MKTLFLMRKVKKYKGFTLIEVVIAISIVIILAALSATKVSGYITKAKNVKIINTSKQIYNAAMWSYSEQGNVFSKEKIKQSLDEVMGASAVAADHISIATSKATIEFTVDSVGYSIVVDSADSSYEVKKGSDIIFNSKV